MLTAETLVRYGLIMLIFAILEGVLQHKGYKLIAKILHYTILCGGLILLVKIFWQFVGIAETLLIR